MKKLIVIVIILIIVFLNLYFMGLKSQIRLNELKEERNLVTVENQNAVDQEEFSQVVSEDFEDEVQDIIKENVNIEETSQVANKEIAEVKVQTTIKEDTNKIKAEEKTSDERREEQPKTKEEVNNTEEQIEESKNVVEETVKEVEKKEEIVETKEEIIEETIIDEVTEKTTTEKTKECSHSEINYYNTKNDAISIFLQQEKEWETKWLNDEIDDDEYFNNRPNGYEVISCPYCEKWTINIY